MISWAWKSQKSVGNQTCLLPYPTRDLLRRPRPVEEGVTIFTIFVWTKWFECRKNPSPAVTWTPSNVLSRHMPWEPHTNRNEIFLYILNISDFSWFWNLALNCNLLRFNTLLKFACIQFKVLLCMYLNQKHEFFYSYILCSSLYREKLMP